MSTSSLLTPLVDNANGPFHLIMCPFAGGSGSAFQTWRALTPSRQLPSLTLVTYPGRDRLRNRPPAQSIEVLADQLADTLSMLDPRMPVVMAGHSMGAQVAFETCARLHGSPHAPQALVISGCHAPHEQGRRQLRSLNDSAFIEQLADIGGCSPALLEAPELMALFMPLLRADFHATETYHRTLPAHDAKLHLPALLLCGRQDREASAEEVAAWQAWLPQADAPAIMEGDHFYPLQHPSAFLHRIVHHFHLHAEQGRHHHEHP
ncbi:thioesterase II family protein [Zymobacter palmae]|uniref:Predicted thioesterase n=1 Tax=Zymobacter palmae TaxID=33074 RepID=A0A348HD71_9GAMM|nr:alpha/beta fold hydrolase [Zymobacter palmae]BBG29573.1 predicted thioesterase [Zymobacter palmae]